ncbi:MAG: hypothetical protein ABI425_03810 [Patescibacteria group bacterium]
MAKQERALQHFLTFKLREQIGNGTITLDKNDENDPRVKITHENGFVKFIEDSSTQAFFEKLKELERQRLEQ